ncbi:MULTISPECIES: RICIN domain-containing protein [unclassified Streptomyces]|uniref:RICIN domain-containing protein n=1 Tax=unclassified Streptomyces TaxID=2593676 RepID=UPI0036B2FE77
MAAGRPDEVHEEQQPARALGRALRDLQRRSGCTLRSLETRVRISDSSLSRYFRGATVPPWATVRDLCVALGGDPADYRTLWEAADRGQRMAAGAGGAASATDGAATGAGGATAAGDAGPSGEAPPRVPGRRGRLFAALAGGVCGLVLGAAGAVWVLPVDPGTGGGATAAFHGPAPGANQPRIFVNRATGACLDDSLDVGTRSYGCNGLPYQRWTVVPAEEGGARLRNHATGRCLEHTPGGLRGAACGPSAAQRWTVAPRDEAAAEIRSAVGRLCLDDDAAAGLRAVPCDRTARQKWA